VFQWNNIDIVSVIISIGIVTWYGFTKHWIANNIFGICFSIQGISLLSIGSYKIGSMLLVCDRSNNDNDNRALLQVEPAIRCCTHTL
jgi:hypothetical protein